jgi:Uncharacterised nucleotidyltransferase
MSQFGPTTLTTALLKPARMAGFSLSQWDELIRLARAADLTARLSALVRQQGLWDAVPEGPRRYLRSGELVCQRQHIELGFETQEIEMALASLNVPVVLLKGAAYVLAGLHAGQGRMVSDVDILVPRASLSDVESALMMATWMSSAKSDYDQRYYRQWMHELPPMQHIKRGTVLDVHHAILPSTARLHPSSERLLAQARPLRPGSCLHVLAPMDMVLHSATHLMHEGNFEQGARGLVDLAALLGEFMTPDRDWPGLVERAVELELTRPLYYALRQLGRQMAFHVAPALLSAAEAAPGARPNGLQRQWMDAMFDRVLCPAHPLTADAWTPMARQFMYVRGHWLRMPPWQLAIHLGHKAFTKDKTDGAV